MKQDLARNQTLRYGFLCVADKPTATTLRQELMAKAYHLGGSQIYVGDVREYNFWDQEIADHVKTNMPAPLQDWKRAFKDFQDALEAYFGYNVYINNIPERASISELAGLFYSKGTVKSFSNEKYRPGKVFIPYGFVTSGPKAEAEDAVNSLNGYDLYGRKLGVAHAEFARPLSHKPWLHDSAWSEQDSDETLEEQSLKESDGKAESVQDPVNDADEPSSVTAAPALWTFGPRASPSGTSDECNPSNDEPTEDDKTIDSSIIRLGPDILDIVGAVVRNSQRFTVETTDGAVQQLVKCAEVREAMKRLLGNEHLVYRAL